MDTRNPWIRGIAECMAEFVAEFVAECVAEFVVGRGL
jgi:hypothetical protein